jgi:hypothetical protein
VHDEWAAHRRKSTERFIKDAHTVHGDRYDYGLVCYQKSNEKVQIGCMVHGVFEQTPNQHLRGDGCPRCGGTVRLTTDEFVRRARLLHRDRYGYDAVDYINMTTKVTVTCKEHQGFLVTPANHLFAKNGCPLCRKSKGEMAVEEWLEDHGVVYQSQKRFSACRHKRPLPFDFYLPVLGLLIEFDGDQHRGNLASWSDFSREEVQRRDEIKTRWCRLNRKLLLRISRINAVAPSLRAAVLGTASTKVGYRVLEDFEAQRRTFERQEKA